MQMCGICEKIYDESEYPHCPYCSGELFDDEDEDGYEDDEMEEYQDPGWDYVYDENGNSISCPNCDAEELRFHNGQCCCIECDSTFTDQEIEDYAGPWHHS